MSKIITVNGNVFEYGKNIDWNEHRDFLEKGRKIIGRSIRKFVNYDNIFRMSFDDHITVLKYKDTNDRFNMKFKAIPYPKAFAYLKDLENQHGIGLDGCFYLIEMMLLADESNYSKCPNDMENMIISDISMLYPDANGKNEDANTVIRYAKQVHENFRPMCDYDRGRLEMIDAIDHIFNSAACETVEAMFYEHELDDTIAQNSDGYLDVLRMTWRKAREYVLQNFEAE